MTSIMKTFKIVALKLIDSHIENDIPLIDGLIINTESDRSEWVIEAYISNKISPLFEQKANVQKSFLVETIITHKGNEPAYFNMTVKKIRPIGDDVSVLLIGTLNKERSTYTEQILQELINKGLTGDKLLDAFKEKLK